MLIGLLNALFITLIYWEFCRHHILWFGYYLQVGNRQQLVFRFHIQVVWINDFSIPLSSLFCVFLLSKCVFNQFQQGRIAFIKLTTEFLVFCAIFDFDTWYWIVKQYYHCPTYKYISIYEGWYVCRWKILLM